MSIYLKNILRFLLLISIQVLILNNIPLMWWTHPSGFPPYTPFIYPLFILLLPISTPAWVLLSLGFITGLTMDVFMDTGGMHASACVLMAFLRTNILTAIMPRRINEYINLTPSVKNMGWFPFLTYACVLLFIHHFLFFLLEIWSLKSWTYMFAKIFVTLLTSLIFIVVYTLFFSKTIEAESQD